MKRLKIVIDAPTFSIEYLLKTGVEKNSVSVRYADMLHLVMGMYLNLDKSTTCGYAVKRIDSEGYVKFFACFNTLELAEDYFRTNVKE